MFSIALCSSVFNCGDDEIRFLQYDRLNRKYALWEIPYLLHLQCSVNCWPKSGKGRKYLAARISHPVFNLPWYVLEPKIPNVPTSWTILESYMPFVSLSNMEGLNRLVFIANLRQAPLLYSFPWTLLVQFDAMKSSNSWQFYGRTTYHMFRCPAVRIWCQQKVFIFGIKGKICGKASDVKHCGVYSWNAFNVF